MADQPAEPSKSALKKAEKAAKMEAAKLAKSAKNATLAVGQGKKTDDIIGITTKKNEDFPAWYQEVVLKAEMIEYYNEVSLNSSQSAVPVFERTLICCARFLVSSLCAPRACTSGMSSASGSRSVLRDWAWRRLVFPCSFRPSPSRRRRVSDLIGHVFISISHADYKLDHVEGFAPELAWVTKA